MTSLEETKGFRRKLLEGKKLLGTFLKFPTGHATELLGAVGFDFVIADEEHSVFGRRETDQVILAAKAAGIGSVVRVSSAAPADILAVLDMGADAILVPHVTTVQQAEAIVAAARYRRGARGFALATRAAGFGEISAWEHMDDSDARIAVIAQIEDVEAIHLAEEIAAVDGIDGIFIGRGDLFVGLGAAHINAPEVNAACAAIAAGTKRAGKALSTFVGHADEIAPLRDLGITTFMFSSEQGLLHTSARAAFRSFHDTMNTGAAEA